MILEGYGQKIFNTFTLLNQIDKVNPQNGMRLWVYTYVYDFVFLLPLKFSNQYHYLPWH